MRPDARVRWRCRRGMREMDLLLGRFLDEGYAHLDAAERRHFDTLLDQPDQDIYAWLLGQAPAPSEELRRLVAVIRTCAVTGTAARGAET